jgi:hypothetical protein
MKAFHLSTVFVFFLFSLGAGAQKTPSDYAFKVLVNKGKNEVKSGSGGWQPIKTGATLKAGDEVKLTDNAYLGLIHSSGKPVEVKKAGNYKVETLEKGIQSGTSVLNKYTDFVLSSNTQKQNKLSATGAVHRGLHTVKIFLPKSEAAFIFGDNLVLNWGSEGKGVNYVVNLKSVFGDDLGVRETTDTTMTFNLADKSFINEDNIIIEIFPKGEPNKRPDPPYMVKKLSPADKQRIKVQLNEIAPLTTEETALNKIILAGFYEQNKLLIDANAAYMDAMKLAPDVQQIREDYQSFLLRNGIKEVKKNK